MKRSYSRKHKSSSKATMTAREVARVSGIGLISVYKLLKSGDLPSIKCGKVFYVPRTALAKWLESGGRINAA